MRPFGTLIARLAATTLLQGLLGSFAIACGFDGLIGDQFSAQHPKSLSVAFAINDAVRSGLIGKSALAPIQAGQQGYWRAMARLAHFAAFLGEQAPPGKSPDVSILLIDSQLWTRLRAGVAGFDIEAHQRGPQPGDAVIITNEFVLSAILDGNLSARRAFQLRVLAVDGERPSASWVEEQISVHAAPENNRVDKELTGKLVNPWGSKRTAVPSSPHFPQ